MEKVNDNKVVQLHYVVFPEDLTYTSLAGAEVWVADEGTYITPSENTGADIVDGIDECTNTPCAEVCKKYDIAGMFAKLEELDLLKFYLVE